MALSAQGQDLTYADLLTRVRRRASAFRARGVRAGQRVTLYTDDDLQLPVSMFALWGLGATCLPMNVTQRRETLVRIEGIVAPDMGFHTAEFVPELERAFPWHPLAEDGPEDVDLLDSDPDGLAIIMFTSGTSGVPKAVPMTHGAIGRNAWETSRRLAITDADRILTNSPPYYTSPIIHFLTLLARGGSAVVDRGMLFGSTLLESITANRCTGFGGVPVHFSRLAASLEAGQEPPACLRFLMNSGEHLPTPVLRAIRAAFPAVAFYCVYGMTEVAGRLCILDPALTDAKLGSVGTPLPGMTLTIRDDAGDAVAAGEHGQVFVEGPGLMSGYLGQAGADAMTPHGFATGDFGALDEDGCLTLRGRRDDILKVGGEKVSVKTIEDALYGLAGVADFLVVPRHVDHMGGMVPCLVYVLAAGSELKRRDLRRHLSARLPANHVPALYEQVDEIPRSTSGKPLRRQGPA